MFSNIKTWWNGDLYDSRGESRYAEHLAWQVARGEIQKVERQVKFPLFENSVLVAHHVVDFVVTNNQGKEEIHEYKGPETDKWRRKLELFVQNYPGRKYITIKEPRKGRYQYFAPSEILGYTLTKQDPSPQKHYSHFEYFCSMIAHHIFKFFLG